MTTPTHPLAGAVKPLEWSYCDEPTGRMYGKAEHYSAVAIKVDGIGKSGLPTKGMPICYTIWPKDPTINQRDRGMTGRRFGVNFNGFEVCFLENSTLEAAEAAAQADYTARILSAFSATTLSARVAELERENAALVSALSDAAQARGKAEGTLAASEIAGVVDSWRTRAEAAEAALAGARDAALEEAARVAEDWTPAKHGGSTLAAHVIGASITRAIRALGDKT